MEIYPIVPAAAKSLWFLGAIGLVLGVLLLLFAWIGYSARNSRVEVTDDTIRIVGDLWGRSLPLHSLDLSAARVIGLAASPEFRPTWRSLGTGMPGYASGWFRLRNGERALAYLTSSENLVHIPTSQGYSLLLSVAQPEALLETLRARQSR